MFLLSIDADAYCDARFLCEQYYVTAPKLEVQSVNSHHHVHAASEADADDGATAAAAAQADAPRERDSGIMVSGVGTLPLTPSTKITYVPSHLHHMLFELFKVGGSSTFFAACREAIVRNCVVLFEQNAMRAVVEHHGGNDANVNAHFPPIKVCAFEKCSISVVRQGIGKRFVFVDTQVTAVTSDEDVSIRVSDLGGGIPLCQMPYLFLVSALCFSVPIFCKARISLPC